MFATAQQLVATSDWANALTELDQLRKKYPSFNTSQVDGMYYYALRNYGVDLIQKQGKLENGIYELTLAERFAPLDKDANSLRDGARLYLGRGQLLAIGLGHSRQRIGTGFCRLSSDVGWHNERRPALSDRGGAVRRSAFRPEQFL